MDPPDIRQRFLRGSTRSLVFRVTNEGRVPATNVKVKMPRNDLIRVAGFAADAAGNQSENESNLRNGFAYLIASGMSKTNCTTISWEQHLLLRPA